MSIFRSELMSLCQIFIPTEAAYKTLAVLGEAGILQFRDLNPDVNSFFRPFVGDVRRCDEMERKIDYIIGELKRDNIVVHEDWENLPPAPNPKGIAELEAQLERLEIEIMEISRNQVNLKTNFSELTELYQVLYNAHDFFASQEIVTLEANRANMSVEERERGHLGFVAGVINRKRSFAFERMLWRISRGNIFVKRAELEEPMLDPVTGQNVFKTVFIVFYQGEQLHSRIKKICTGFRAAVYPCPGVPKDRQDMLADVKVRLEDLKHVIEQSDDHRRIVLAAVSKEVMSWSVMLKKMKGIYHTLNGFRKDVTQNCLIGEAWTPTNNLDDVQTILSTCSAESGSTVSSFVNVVDTKEDPPTYFPLNKFTYAFQVLIDSYGVAKYGEVNPGLYTCITFPFLYAVMFGDLGHGLIITLFALWMCIDEKRLTKVRDGGEIWNIFFGGRYIILLLGLFAMYTGLLYNELFSISMNIFGSGWRVNYNESTIISNPSLQLDPTTDAVSVYPLGMDPIWQMADNKIIFTNTFKMKMSIIIAVIHMLFGICLSVANYIHFKKYALIVLEFLPEAIFLLLFFGYLAFMMFYKWIVFTPFTTDVKYGPGCAPSVLIMFIDMMLFKDNTVSAGCMGYMFSIQPTLQEIFVVLAVLCIPWLLVGKPLYVMWERKHAKKHPSPFEIIEVDMSSNKTGVEITIENEGESVNGAIVEEEEEPMSEIWIHQAIHTVEYILSTISHTASYLRLWALSLAHSGINRPAQIY